MLNAHFFTFLWKYDGCKRKCLTFIRHKWTTWTHSTLALDVVHPRHTTTWIYHAHSPSSIKWSIHDTSSCRTMFKSHLNLSPSPAQEAASLDGISATLLAVLIRSYQTKDCMLSSHSHIWSTIFCPKILLDLQLIRLPNAPSLSVKTTTALDRSSLENTCRPMKTAINSNSYMGCLLPDTFQEPTSDCWMNSLT